MSLKMRLYFGLFFVAIIASLFGRMIVTAERVAAVLNDPAVVRRYHQFTTAKPKSTKPHRPCAARASVLFAESS